MIRIFPNEASCLRLIRALASEIHEERLDGACYLSMEASREQNKVQLPLALKDGEPRFPNLLHGESPPFFEASGLTN